MIKRLLLIAIILGLGQVFIVISLKSISSSLSTEIFSLFGQIESGFQFLIILMAAGILSDAIRKITHSKEWQADYLKYQSARVFFSILLFPLAGLFLVNKSFLIFFLAPILAFSGEYAFYGIGKPVSGAIIAFIRIIVPYGFSIMIAKYTPGYFVELFLLLLLLTYFFTGIAIAAFLKIPYFIKPSLPDFRLYLTSLRLGLVNVLLYVQGLGLMIFIPILFTGNYRVISIAFIGLKLYAIYKSIIRIIHQALVREMKHLEACLTVDKLSMILGFVFLISFMLFPNTTVKLLFGSQFLDGIPFFQMMAIACLIFSFCFSLGTNAVLLSYDKKLLRVCILSSAICIGSLLIFSRMLPESYAIGLPLITGETALATGLLFLFTGNDIMIKRILFLLQNLIIFLALLLLKIIFFEDSLEGLLISISCYSLISFFINLKEFNSVKLTQLDLP